MRDRGSSRRRRDDRGVPLPERDRSSLLAVREQPRLALVECEAERPRSRLQRVERQTDVLARTPHDVIVDPPRMPCARVPDRTVQVGEDRVGEDRGRVGTDREAAYAAIPEASKEG